MTGDRLEGRGGCVKFVDSVGVCRMPRDASIKSRQILARSPKDMCIRSRGSFEAGYGDAGRRHAVARHICKIDGMFKCLQSDEDLPGSRRPVAASTGTCSTIPYQTCTKDDCSVLDDLCGGIATEQTKPFANAVGQVLGARPRQQ